MPRKSPDKVAISPTVAPISQEATCIPAKVKGWTVPLLAGRPTCTVRESRVRSAGEYVWTYGPAPVVPTVPKTCFKKVAMVVFGSSVANEPATLLTPGREYRNV